MKRKISSIVSIMLAFTLLMSLAGCAGKNKSLSQAAFVTDISKLNVEENVEIVGLGEASHGTSEFQQLKGEVFKALVTNNGCRIFAIEGDFGGSAKVNDYIHGGPGTAQEAVSQIGFRIYRTQEMADIVEWMRSYNETAPEGKDLKFYGFDAQRFDNNKVMLFAYLEKRIPALSKEYLSKFAALTDADMYSLDSAVLSQAEGDIATLMSEMEKQKSSGMNADEQHEYEKAYEFAQSILDNIQLRRESSSYNQVRDSIMTRKVEWIKNHEDGLIYINGHNGHISRQSASGYTSMGELLNEKYGEAYFPIATDGATTVFNAQDGGEYKEFRVSNRNIFTAQFDSLTENRYYLDFAKASQEPDWKEALATSQTMTALNVEFSGFQGFLKQFYTLNYRPFTAFAGVIVLKNTSPTRMLD